MSRHSYRPDIDGLRAIAVLSVFFFHARPTLLPGGFVGVDIFFVISGFLITGIIADEIRAGTYSHRDFLLRRARRLLPALFAMMVFVVFVGGLISMPEDFSQIGKQIVAQSLIVSNVHFWSTSDYFNALNATTPLLHTWSLSIEAQFYFLFPIAVVLFRRAMGLSLGALIGAGLLASLILCVYLTQKDTNTAFYLLPTRVWEFLLGAAIAIKRPKLSHIDCVLVQLCGLAAILIALFAFGPTTPFPGAAALLPCLGAAALISTGGAAGKGIGAVLQWPPLRSIGIISYSIYLFHWPLLALSRYYLQGELSLGQLAGLVSICLGLSALSWRYIEQPFRDARRGPKLLPHLLGANAVLFFIGLVVIYTSGLPARLPPEVTAFAEARKDIPPQTAACRMSPEQVAAGKLCQLGASKPARTGRFLLVGDSFANALVPMMDSMSDKFGVSGAYAYYPSCPPLFGVNRITSGSWVSHCRAFNDAVTSLSDEVTFSHVLLVARWSAYAEGDYLLGDDRLSGGDAKESQRVLLSALLRTVDMWTQRGAQVWIMRQPPEFAYDVPIKLAQTAARRQNVESLGISLSEHSGRQASIDRIFEKIAGKVHFIDPSEALCNADAFCTLVKNNRSLYRDNQHLSSHGANLLANLFEPFFLSFKQTAAQ